MAAVMKSKKAVAIDERVDRLEEQVRSLSVSTGRLSRSVGQMEALMSAIDEGKARAQLQQFQARIAELSHRLQVEIHKDVVLSEVTRLAPQMWPSLVRALDESDEWWAAREKLTIAGWIEEMKAGV
jgi:DNA-binding FrmR family transcriptional regulator